MEFLRIKQAIAHYNGNSRADGEELLTQGKLAAVVMPELNETLAGQYISSWIHGKRLGALKPHHIISICEITGVDANLLFGIEPTGDCYEVLKEVFKTVNIKYLTVDLHKKIEALITIKE